jgi:hypothetical protein
MVVTNLQTTVKFRDRETELAAVIDARTDDVNAARPIPCLEAFGRQK